MEGGNCKNRNVIYFFQCVICWLGYVGKTDQVVHWRTNGHRTCGISAENFIITDFEALLYHATVTYGLKFDDVYKIWIAKNVNSPTDLLHWEQFLLVNLILKHLLV